MPCELIGKKKEHQSIRIILEMYILFYIFSCDNIYSINLKFVLIRNIFIKVLTQQFQITFKKTPFILSYIGSLV